MTLTVAKTSRLSFDSLQMCQTSQKSTSPNLHDNQISRVDLL